MLGGVSFSVLPRIEANYRDLAGEKLKTAFPKDLHYPLWVHLINAFGYRETWAHPLLECVAFNSRKQPYFPQAPQTPEAHRHKFLFTLTLSEGSPGEWKIGGQRVRSVDFVDAILEGPLRDWGDESDFPEPSWTLQFLSAHLDVQGRWKGESTAFAGVTQATMVQYFRDFDSGDLYERGKTIFTESGLHGLEAMNKLVKAQSQMVIEPATHSGLEKFFPMLKKNFGARLTRSVEEIRVILTDPQAKTPKLQKQVIPLALSNLLVAGHLLEAAFHPQGALRDSWTASEKEVLKGDLQWLERLMEFFLEEKTQAILSPQEKKAFHFPLLHSYHALRLAS